MDKINPPDPIEGNPEKEEILKTRYIERNFEKLQKSLKYLSKTSPKDYIIIALLVILIILNLFGPSSFSSWKSADNNFEKKLETLSAKINSLEKALLTPPEEISETTAGNPETQDNGNKVQADAIKENTKLYKIRNGDTLSVIILRVYNSKDPEVIEALAAYNNLKPPYVDIYPGSVIKVPPLKALMEWKKNKK